MSLPKAPRIAFVNHTKANPKISKLLIVFLASTQLLFGFNLGFVKQMKKFKMAAQLLSMTTGLIMSAFITYMFVYSKFSLIYAIQYILTFVVLLAGSYTFYDFLMDIQNIKPKIKQDFIFNNIGTVTWMYTTLMFSLKFIAGALYHVMVYHKISPVIRVLYLIPILCLDNLPVALFLVFYHVYAKLKQLKLGFQNGETTVQEVLATYKNVVDLIDKIRTTTDQLIVLGFVADCPKWILTIWSHLILMQTTESWTLVCCSSAYALDLTLQMVVPAVCAELVSAETDALHVSVHERLLDEPDESAARSLSQLARYLRARRPLRPALRLLPAGLRLPTAMLSMCATYLVVVIQLTHLYD